MFEYLCVVEIVKSRLVGYNDLLIRVDVQAVCWVEVVLCSCVIMESTVST